MKYKGILAYEEISALFFSLSQKFLRIWGTECMWSQPCLGNSSSLVVLLSWPKQVCIKFISPNRSKHPQLYDFSTYIYIQNITWCSQIDLFFVFTVNSWILGWGFGVEELFCSLLLNIWASVLTSENHNENVTFLH